MSKLLEHFKRMQDACVRYIEPGNPSGATVEMCEADQRFISAMIYMLDGPEQREAEHDMSELLDQLADVQNLRNRVAVLESDLTRANARCKPLEDENNDLRSRLMTGELAYAKLRGYVERIEDERPVEMVPAPRERFLAHSPDATMGTEYGGWRGGDSHRDHRWYHR